MATQAENRVIATAALVSVGVGTANAILKEKRTPSARFLIGSGLAFLALSVLAEWSGELAKSLAVAVAATVVLGEGDGLFSYVNIHGEADTQRQKASATARHLASLPGLTPMPPPVVVHHATPGAFRPDQLPSFPGLTPTPPVIPNH